MSTFLSHVGRFAARFRWLTIGAWVVIFAALVAVFAVGSSTGGAGGAEASIPDTPASVALERMDQEFPAADQASQTLQLVFHPNSGNVTEADTASAIARVLADANDLPGVKSVSNPLDPEQPYLSQDKTLAVATLTYGDLSAAQQTEYYEAALAFQQRAPKALGVELGGNLVPLGAPAPGAGEGLGAIIALVVLALTFGSLLTAGMNLLLAAFGVGVGLMGILAYGSLMPIGDTTIILAAMLGLAVGIDYNLFIISRFRSELRGGRSVDQAIARAVGTAGTAVVFAGLTVIVALVALLTANISFITEMGIAAAFGVGVAVLISLTLLPALLKFVGVRALSRTQRQALGRGELWTEGQVKQRGLLPSWGNFVVKRPVVALFGGVVVLLVVAFPMLSMKTAFNVPGGADPSSTERTAYNLILDKFGGVQSPLIVLAEGDHLGSRTNEIAQQLSDLDGVQQVAPAEVNADGTVARIIVFPKAGPIDQSTKNLVREIRNQADSISEVHLEVTGEAAIGIDQDAQLMKALVRYVIVIAVISILLLIVLFRSIVIPLVATAGFLLSVGASFGASVAVFQWGWFSALVNAPQGDPMLSMLPLLLVGVLFGLAMDYQVFLVSRIQEMYHRGLSPKDAIREGFARTGSVLVAAATIMIVVFAGFATSSFAIAASIAFGLAVGVAADAFIVRLVLMPALLSLLGRSAWWLPKWLDRIIPNVDVEGHSLDIAEPAPEATRPVLVGQYR